jgi:hypothetical protein
LRRPRELGDAQPDPLWRTRAPTLCGWLGWCGGDVIRQTRPRRRVQVGSDMLVLRVQLCCPGQHAGATERPAVRPTYSAERDTNTNTGSAPGIGASGEIAPSCTITNGRDQIAVYWIHWYFWRCTITGRESGTEAMVACACCPGVAPRMRRVRINRPKPLNLLVGDHGLEPWTR